MMLLTMIDCFLLALLPTLFVYGLAKIKKMSLLMILFCFTTIFYGLELLFGRVNITSLLVIGLVLILTFFIYYYFLKDSFQAIYYSMFINYVVIFIILLCLFVMDYFGVSPILSVNLFFCFPIVFFICLSVVYLFKNLHQAIIEYLSTKKVVFLIVCSSFLIIVSFYSDVYRNHINNIANYSIELILGLIVLLVLYLLFLQNAYNKTIKQNEITNKIILQQTLEFQKLLEKEKEIRELKHNMKHILLSILDQYKANPQQIKATVLKQLNYLDNQEKIINTGQTCLDLIISYYMPLIKEKDIDLITNYFPEQNLLTGSDIYIILGNIIENAIEHCNAKTKNKIIIYTNIKDNSYYFQIKNTIDCNIKIDLKHSKKQENGHGYGIESVKKLVRKNNGQIYFFQDMIFFYVELYLPL